MRVCFREGAYFSATLVNSNIGHNTNKFYVLQIVEEITDPEKFFLFTRYGRLGSGGYREEFGPWNFDLARKKYNEKLNKKFNSGYHVVAMDHSSSDNAIQKIIKMPI